MSDDLAQRAVRAKQILEDEIFIEAWEKVERMNVEVLLNIDVTDENLLLKSIACVRAIRDVREVIRGVMLDAQDRTDSDIQARQIV